MTGLESADTAIVCDVAAPTAAAVRDYAAAQGLAGARWYAARDVDDVDRAVQSGMVRRVIFPDLDSFLVALWDERIDAAAWRAARVQLDFIATPGTPAATLDATCAAWQAWRQGQRRRQARSGIVLSVFALAAAFGLLLLAR